MWNDLPPEVQIALGVFAFVVVVRLFVLVGEQLERPNAPPSVAEDASEGPLHPPSWFAPPHERMLYDLEINRTATELVQSHVQHATATTNLVRASHALDTAIAETTPTAATASTVVEPALSRADLQRLVTLLPELTPEARARLLSLIDAALEETRR